MIMSQKLVPNVVMLKWKNVVMEDNLIMYVVTNLTWLVGSQECLSSL